MSAIGEEIEIPPCLDSFVDTFDYSAWPELEGASELEFHLIYQGELPAASQSKNRAREKQNIRQVFHKQLVSLWNTHPFLVQLGNDSPKLGIANRYARCGFRFLPLVSDWFMAACALDILFLRRDGPGSLIKSGGDIDNRLKVLFD